MRENRADWIQTETNDIKFKMKTIIVCTLFNVLFCFPKVPHHPSVTRTIRFDVIKNIN